MELEWKGSGVEEKGVDKATGKVLVEIDERYHRPAEVDLLVGDATKAKNELGWESTHDINSLVKDMVQADLTLFKRDKYLLQGGHKVMNYHE